MIELLDQPIPEGSISVTVPCQDDRYSISTGRSACRGREGDRETETERQRQGDRDGETECYWCPVFLGQRGR